MQDISKGFKKFESFTPVYAYKAAREYYYYYYYYYCCYYYYY